MEDNIKRLEELEVRHTNLYNGTILLDQKVSTIGMSTAKGIETTMEIIDVLKNEINDIKELQFKVEKKILELEKLLIQIKEQSS